MTEAQWRWKAKARAAPVENVGVAVGPDDQPIFQFVGIPCPALVLGAPRTVMVGADVVTAPPYRRRGVFTSAVRDLFQSWREAGVALVLGLANDPAWGSRARALGYERYFALQRMIRPLRPDRLLARNTGVRAFARLGGIAAVWNRLWDHAGAAPGDIVVRSLDSATPDIDAVWERTRRVIGSSLVRDRAWVAWRYDACPIRAYHLTLAERGGEPAGYAVHSVTRTDNGTSMQIAELFAPADGMAVRALVGDLVARAVALEADTIVAFAVPDSIVAAGLRRAGFVFSRHGWLFEVVRLDPSIPRDALQDPRGWWLAGGDFDVV